MASDYQVKVDQAVDLLTWLAARETDLAKGVQLIHISETLIELVKELNVLQKENADLLVDLTNERSLSSDPFC